MADHTDIVELTLPVASSVAYRNMAIFLGGGLVAAGGSDCTETNLSTPTLTFPLSPPPQLSLVESSHHRTDVTPHGDGTEKRLRRWTTNRLAYQLTWNVLTKADADILWAFFESCKGRFYKFTFIDPRDGVTSLGQFRFDADMMSRENFEWTLYRMGFKIVQVLDDPVV
jgi:hypothetical protein